MLKIKNFNASESFVDFFKSEYEKLESKLNLADKDITLYAFGEISDLPLSYRKAFEGGQSTMILKKEGKLLILAVEENWEKRGREFWRGMFAESLCYSLIRGKSPAGLDGKLDLLFYKTRRLLEVHSVLAEAQLYEYFDPILADMIAWRLENFRDFGKAMLVRSEIGALILLSFIYPAIIALPYAKKGVGKAKERISTLTSYLPRLLRRDIAQIFEKSSDCEDLIDRLYDFISIAYLASL